MLIRLPAPTSTSSRSASAATSSAGAPTRTRRSPCSTRYVAAGGNVVDTADVYSRLARHTRAASRRRSSAAGCAARGNRDAGRHRDEGRQATGLDNLRPETIRAAPSGRCSGCGPTASTSTTRTSDHDDDLGEALEAFDSLVRAGKVRHIAASQPHRSAAHGGARPAGGARLGAVRRAAAALQPRRARRSTRRASPTSASSAASARCPTSASRAATSPASTASADPRSRACGPGRGGVRRRARRARWSTRSTRSPPRTACPAAVALAWLRTRPAVVAPIASARTLEQLAELLPMASLELGPDELALLESVSA